MLVLTRKLQEQIRIGNNITVTILRVKGNSVRVGIEAPRDVRVVRGELPPKTADRPAVAVADTVAPGESAADESPASDETNINHCQRSDTEPAELACT